MDETMQTDHEAIIIANGEFPSDEHSKRLIKQSPLTVCCDGAAEEYIKHYGLPDAVVGDCDSIPPATARLCAGRLHRISEQDTNDLTKTIHYLQDQGIKKIIILGATGKREDHTIGNISLLIDYMHMGIQVQMHTPFGNIIPSNGTQTFHCQKGQQISIFNFGAHNLHAQGLRYPLSDFHTWWQGTLNEATTTQFTIHATGDYLIYLATEEE